MASPSGPRPANDPLSASDRAPLSEPPKPDNAPPMSPAKVVPAFSNPLKPPPSSPARVAPVLTRPFRPAPKLAANDAGNPSRPLSPAKLPLSASANDALNEAPRLDSAAPRPPVSDKPVLSKPVNPVPSSVTSVVPRLARPDNPPVKPA